MYCKKCGMQVTEGRMYCGNCGTRIDGYTTYSNGQVKFLPSFILGLIGTVFGIGGGLCMTMCTSMYSSGMPAFVLILGGSIVGLIGACKCLSNAKTGSIIELIGAVMIMICAFGITGADISTMIAMLMFVISGVIGLIYSVFKTKI